MKKVNITVPTLLLFTLISGLSSFAQLTPAQLRPFIDSNQKIKNSGIREFYARMNYQPVWIKPGGHTNRKIFFEAVRQSAGLGLEENAYRPDHITVLEKEQWAVPTIDDSLEAEVNFTATALRFYSDLVYGNIKPALGYNGLTYIPGCRDIPALLAHAVTNNTLQLMPARLSHPSPVINTLEKKIGWFHRVMADSNFREQTIRSDKVTGTNHALAEKLYQLGIFPAGNRQVPDSILKQYVKEAQRQFNLAPDGVLRSPMLQELNVLLAARLQQSVLALNYYRWLSCLVQNQSVIVVNIPAAYMKVYNHGKVILEMRMIVGKTSTPTSTLASKVNEVILYPYWHVPFSIATKELLPAIKRNPGYINTGNYQVLNKAGNIVDPYSVNWHALSRSYFPYLIRQSTGCDNALGLLKLNFYNPYGIYLHDTPGKNLFRLNKRFFSHGCMRMEKPMELGHMILKNNSIAIDTLEQKGCLRNQSPVTVRADDQMPVVVWYNPVDVDSTGRIIFYEDVYKKFVWRKRK